MERRVKQNREVIGTEGSDEAIFLDHLKSLYCNGDPTNPKVFDCGGSTPKVAVQTMRQALPGLGSYSRRLILLDHDRNSDKIVAGEKEAEKEPSIEIIFADTRFECEMLRIASVSQSTIEMCSGSNAEVAKEEFAKICDRTLTGTDKSYDVVFPKELLDTKRESIEWLNQIISAIEECD